MTSEFRYLFRSQRWTARLARAAVLSNLLAIPLLFCLLRATDGIRYLVDFPLAWRLGLIFGPPLLAIVLFRRVLPWFLSLLLFTGFLTFAEIAGQRFGETEINPWQPIDPDLQPWIRQYLGYADVADFAELYDKPSPDADEIGPLTSQLYEIVYFRGPALWILKNANTDVLHGLIDAGSNFVEPARLVAQKLTPDAHRKLARSFPDDFQNAAVISPPCYWDDDTQWRLWQANRSPSFNPWTSARIYDHMQAIWAEESDVSPEGLFDGEYIFTQESLALLDTGDYYEFVMNNHPGVRHLPDYVEAANYPQLTDAQRQRIPRHVRTEMELFYFGANALLPEIRAKPESSPLDCDELLPAVGPSEYLSLARRAVSNGGDAWRWLNLGQQHASLRGKVLAAIQDLQPSLSEDAYYLFEQQVSATDGLLCLRLFAAEDADASDARALLDGTHSRAESHVRRKAHFAKDSTSKASRFLDVALRMKTGPEKSRRLEDMGTIRCGLRKREAAYLALLFVITGVICALLPSQSPQEDPKDERS
jgi:hypothetical protein